MCKVSAQTNNLYTLWREVLWGYCLALDRALTQTAWFGIHCIKLTREHNSPDISKIVQCIQYFLKYPDITCNIISMFPVNCLSLWSAILKITQSNITAWYHFSNKLPPPTSRPLMGGMEWSALYKLANVSWIGFTKMLYVSCNGSTKVSPGPGQQAKGAFWVNDEWWFIDWFQYKSIFINWVHIWSCIFHELEQWGVIFLKLRSLKVF